MGRGRGRFGLRSTADVGGCKVSLPSDWGRPRICSGAGSSTDSFDRAAPRQGSERCREIGRGNLRDLDHRHIARGHGIGNHHP